MLWVRRSCATSPLPWGVRGAGERLSYAAPGEPTTARLMTVVSLIGAPIVHYCQPSMWR